MGFQDFAKLPGLLTQLVDKIPAEVEARAEAKVKELLDGRAKELEATVEKAVEERVEAVLKRVFGDGFDLSGFEAAVGRLASGVESAINPKADPAPEPNKTDPKPAADDKPTDAPKPETEVASGFADFSRQSDARTEAGPDPKNEAPINGVQSRAFD